MMKEEEKTNKEEEEEDVMMEEKEEEAGLLCCYRHRIGRPPPSHSRGKCPCPFLSGVSPAWLCELNWGGSIA